MSNFDSPIPLSEIESVLAWVDTFKLSRPTKKINRDFSDAVLLAEILNVHYPKLVEMHNYPPRNSHSLKLNNWLTLNRKVLKKLKLNLCCNTMEQLANCTSGVIERVLVMVRDKIRRDEDMNKSMKDSEQNMSSGGSYYEACGEDENVLVVPVKRRMNGVLETVQQKVVNYDSYLLLKEELKDAKDSVDLLKQKVDHLDNLLSLKEHRIEELQKQLDRKQARRKEAEAFQNSLQVPFEAVASPTVPNPIPSAVAPSPVVPGPPVPSPAAPSPMVPYNNENPIINIVMKSSARSVETNKMPEESKIPVKTDSKIKSVSAKPSITEVTSKDLFENDGNLEMTKSSYTKFSAKYSDSDALTNLPTRVNIKPKVAEMIVNYQQNLDVDVDVDRIKSDVFKEIEIVDDKTADFEEFKDSEPDNVTTIEQTIQKEIKNIINPMKYMQDLNC